MAFLVHAWYFLCAVSVVKHVYVYAYIIINK